MHIVFYKRIFLAIITILLVVFTSCKNINQHYEYFDSHCGITTNSSNGDYYPIHSEEEKDAFLSHYRLNVQFLGSLNKYDENYFSTKYIIILVMPRSSSSFQYKLINIHIDENIEFEIKMKTKSPSNEDLVNKAFIVELSQDSAQLGYKISISKE